MTITPQALGSLIKRTGVMKSADRKGNSFNYHTEGYSLTRQWGYKYTLNYYSRLSLARPTEGQEQAFQARQAEAFDKITQALEAKGIRYTIDGSTIWIYLEAF
jgi:hypothetical protein